MASTSAHERIAQILKMDKEAHWLENAHLPPDEIQRQWAIKSAPLNAVLGVEAPSHPIDLDSIAEDPTSQRTMQSATAPKTIQDRKAATLDHSTHNSKPLDAVGSDPIPKAQTRKRPTPSRNGPFIDTETAVPPLTLNTWQASHDEPFNFYSSASSSPPAFKTRKTATGRLPNPSPDYSSVSVYEPADFVKQNHFTLSPSSPVNLRSRRNSSQNLSPSSYLSQSPSTPASERFTNATALSSVGMSRSDSLGGSSFYGGFNMLKVDSQRSECIAKSDEDAPHMLDSQSPSMGGKVPANDLSLSLSHTGGMIEHTGALSVPHTSDPPKLPLVAEEEGTMSRTVSSESTASRSRILRRSQEQAASSIRPIAPKDDAESMSRQSSSSSSSSSSLGSAIAGQVSADGSKIAIQKAKYQRPTHEKIKCTLCNIKPDGYRGPHELRRHMDNKHGATRKVWVCKDLSPDQMFLSNCKQCKERKTYGAYYNAACHLRRIHWNPREKGKKTDKSGKGRGGNGGGDHPSMNYLKLWMEEIYVPVTRDIPAVEHDPEETDSPNDPTADASQDNLDCATNDFSTTSSAEPHQQEHYTPAYDDEVMQADPSISNAFLDVFNSPYDDTLRKQNTALTFDMDSTKDITHPTSTIPSAPTDIIDISETSQGALVNGVSTFGNVESADSSFSSSINLPVGHLDQFNSLLFDSDLFNFPS